jgi:hypothetical protein
MKFEGIYNILSDFRNFSIGIFGFRTCFEIKEFNNFGGILLLSASG